MPALRMGSTHNDVTRCARSAIWPQTCHIACRSVANWPLPGNGDVRVQCHTHCGVVVLVAITICIGVHSCSHAAMHPCSKAPMNQFRNIFVHEDSRVSISNKKRQTGTPFQPQNTCTSLSSVTLWLARGSGGDRCKLYIYIYIYTHKCVCIYIYIYICLSLSLSIYI